uniref:Uncharacterized protein n=1 Tax=Rhodococcus sp. NS1 TaxID=402236 RepID=A0A097SR16_9NOCA|nr:hypothetical protein LRS1606.532 [Rhodococcus sp. NS1]
MGLADPAARRRLVGAWYSPRPATGRVHLTGRLVGDFAYATTGSVRGRVTAARSMNETASAGRHEPGILADLDLDLDDVPPPPLRPSIIPRAISAAGRMLWAADEQLTLIVRIDLDDPTEIRTVVLPAPIASQPGHIPWRLHADPQGCWIAGWYGIFRATDTAAARRLDDRWVDASATHHGTLLTCTHDTTDTRIGLWHFDGQSHHDDTTLPPAPSPQSPPITTDFASSCASGTPGRSPPSSSPLISMDASPSDHPSRTSTTTPP